MHLVTGINHVAVMTDDLDRFVDFYTSVFELEVIFEETTPEFRHAILRTGPDSWLHPAEVPGNPHGHARPEMFQRGHLDHVALTAGSMETFETLRGNLIRHLDKLDKKITGSLKQRSEPRLKRVTALSNMVYPRGEVQERELSLLSFLPRYGFELIDELLERLEFPCWEHQVVVL